MANKYSLRKIIWAIDAFEEISHLQERVSQSVRALVLKTGAVAEAVHILTPGQMDLSLEFGERWISQYRPAAENAMEHLLNRLNIRSMVSPKVIVEDFASTAQAVSVLSDYAAKAEADLIICGTHGRHGMRRLILGSFAETLLQHSRTPVMTVGALSRRTVDGEPEFERILFPTDFGDSAKATFREVVELASSLGSRITLFHAIPHPVEPVLQSGAYLLGGGWVPVENYVQGESERKRRHAEAWARWALAQGIETDIEIRDSRFTSVPDLIETVARDKGCGLIAMEAQSGPVVAALIGSVTRQVIRTASCPVWVLRSKLATVHELQEREKNRRVA